MGELGKLENHLESDTGCGYVEVTCGLSAYEGQSLFFSSHTWGCQKQVICGVKVERRSLAVHHEECKYRQYTCEYCGYTDTYDAIGGSGQLKNQNSTVNSYMGNHYKTCDHFPLECVNKCGEMNIFRKEMSSHRNSCPLEPLKCPLGEHDPRRTVLRKDMEKHKSEKCEFRPYTCQYCNHTGTYRSITGKGETPLNGKPHYHVCGDYPLDCPNQCGAMSIKRKNMSSHRKKCRLEQLDCPYKFAKCTGTVLRKDMDDHCQKNMQQHLLLVAQSHQELAKSHQELAHKNLELEQKNKELTDKINKLVRRK